jgi:S-adenosylmethionine uptake transporter
MPALKGESLKIILISLLGWTCFSTGDVITKHLSASYNPSVIVTLGAIVNCLIIALWILKQKGLKGFLTPKWKLFALRAVCTGIISYTVVHAFSLAPMADVYGLTFFAPLLSVMLAALILKESVGWHRITAIIAGFIGVLILVGPQYETLNTGLIYASIATVATAFSIIFIRKIGTTNVYMPLLILYAYLGILCVNLPPALPDLHIIPAPDIYLALICAGLILFAIYLSTYAFSHAQSTAGVAPFVYIQAIWGVVFGYFFFDDIPTPATITGLIIVVTAGLYMICHENKLRVKG